MTMVPRLKDLSLGNCLSPMLVKTIVFYVQNKTELESQQQVLSEYSLSAFQHVLNDANCRVIKTLHTGADVMRNFFFNPCFVRLQISACSFSFYSIHIYN